FRRERLAALDGGTQRTRHESKATGAVRFCTPRRACDFLVHRFGGLLQRGDARRQRLDLLVVGRLRGGLRYVLLRGFERRIGAPFGVARGGVRGVDTLAELGERTQDRKSTRLNSSHSQISYAVFC